MALMRPALQSDTYESAVASLAVDNDLTTSACGYSYAGEPWWSVDLGTPMDVGRICVVIDTSTLYGQQQLIY